MQKKLIKNYRLFLILILILPVLINIILLCSNPITWIIPVVGKNTEWISFWGSYAGSIVSVIIMLFVLYTTLDDSRKAQDKNILFERNRNKLDEFKKNVLEIYNLFDFKALITSADDIKYGDLRLAKSRLRILNLTLQDQIHKIKILCFPSDDAYAEEEKAYINKLVKLRLEFGILVDDLIITIEIGEALDSSEEKDEIIRLLYKLDRQNKDPEKNSKEEILNYGAKSKILHMIDELQSSTCKNIPNKEQFMRYVINEYYPEIQNIKENKSQLVDETISIINFKERQLDESLKR